MGVSTNFEFLWGLGAGSPSVPNCTPRPWPRPLFHFGFHRPTRGWGGGGGKASPKREGGMVASSCRLLQLPNTHVVPTHCPLPPTNHPPAATMTTHLRSCKRALPPNSRHPLLPSPLNLQAQQRCCCVYNGRHEGPRSCEFEYLPVLCATPNHPCRFLCAPPLAP
jgi:hypothetical protein